MEPERERPPDPPASWQEHWFDHRQLLQLYYSDDDCAIYLDPDVRQPPGPLAAAVHRPGLAVLQGDVRRTGSGPTRASTPSTTPGGTAAATPAITSAPCTITTTSATAAWTAGGRASTLARELPAHEIGHSVESANNGVHGSPAYEIWGDSKWAEFYIYDLYTALGMDRDAKHVHRRFTGNSDDFPRPGTRWFRDWFYPLWRECGQAAVMARFFRQLADAFPPRRGRYVHAADELGRVHPLHQRRRRRRPEQPGRPRLRLAPGSDRPARARA